MVRRLIQQQHIRMRHHRLRNRQPLALSRSAQLRAASASRLGKPVRPLRLPQPSLVLPLSATFPRTSAASNTSRTVTPGGKHRLLLHIPNPRPLPHRNVPGISIFIASQTPSAA